MRRYSISKAWFAIVVSIATTACASKTPPLSLANPDIVRVTSGTALPPPTNDVTASLSNGLLVPRDHVAITVFNMPEISLQDVEISSSGRVEVPLAGSFLAAGKTPNDLAREIEAGLKRSYVRDPRVAVNVRDAADKTFTIDGAITRPGEFAANENLSLMKAVAIAQGLTEVAAVESVVIYRTVGQQQMAAIYDLAAIRQGVYPDPKIFPNDSILVGESAARRLYRDFKTILPTLASPLVFLLQ